MLQKKYIIFDIDGTLVNTCDTYVKSLQQTVQELDKVHLSYLEAYSYFGKPSSEVIRTAFKNQKSDTLDVWEKHFRDFRHLIQPYDGIRELLNALVAKGIKCGVVTSRNRLELFNDSFMGTVINLFEANICADDTTEHKPHPAPLLKYLELSGAKAEECLYIGDTLYDLHCAIGAGIEFGFAHWGIPEEINEDTFFQNRAELKELSNYIFTKPEELISLINI